MPYVQSWTSLRRHPKLSRLRSALADGGQRPSTALILGHLHLLWHWTLEYAPHGDLSSYTDDELADAAEWTGDPTLWCHALAESGWLDPDRHVHDWDQYAGAMLRKREARQQARAKGQPFGDKTPAPPTTPEPAGLAGLRALRHQRKETAK